MFSKNDTPDTFTESVVDFLARISLTHTIVDVEHSTDRILYGIDISKHKKPIYSSEFNIWTQPSFDGNIDCEMIESVMKNIGGK